MKILVKDIPKNCKNCFFVRQYNFGTKHYCILTDIFVELTDKWERDKDCPLEDVNNNE